MSANPIIYMLISYVFVSLGLTLFLMLLGRCLPVLRADVQKIAPYECGFDPINSARLPFSFRFFLIAILFLIFDLEIVLLLVLPFIVGGPEGVWSIFPFLVFMFILVRGLAAE